MAAKNPYFPAGASGPAENVFAIVPDDATDLPFVTTGIYVGGEGDVVVQNWHTGVAVKFPAVPVGTILPIRVARVLAATTASGLVGMA